VGVDAEQALVDGLGHFLQSPERKENREGCHWWDRRL
jgi:hypothetical protein